MRTRSHWCSRVNFEILSTCQGHPLPQNSTIGTHRVATLLFVKDAGSPSVQHSALNHVGLRMLSGESWVSEVSNPGTVGHTLLGEKGFKCSHLGNYGNMLNVCMCVCKSMQHPWKITAASQVAMVSLELPMILLAAPGGGGGSINFYLPFTCLSLHGTYRHSVST